MRSDSGGPRAGDDAAVLHVGEQPVGRGPVVVDAAPVAPSRRREVERHGVVLLAVRRRRLAVGRAVGLHRPREEAVGRVGRIVVEHEGAGPVPQRVELGLLVQLHRDHHPVRHALASHVAVVDVAEVGQPPVRVLAGPVEDRLRRRVPVEELLERGVDLLPDRLVCMTGLAEQVPVLARGERAAGSLRRARPGLRRQPRAAGKDQERAHHHGSPHLHLPCSGRIARSRLSTVSAARASCGPACGP